MDPLAPTLATVPRRDARPMPRPETMVTGAAPNRVAAAPVAVRTSPARAVRRLVIALAAVQAVVVAVNLSPLIDRYTVARLIGINSEASLTAWFSSAVLLAIAAAAGFCAVADRASGAPRRLWAAWAVIAAFFVLLSIDETATLHELIGEKAHRFLDFGPLPSLYTWVLVVTPLGVVAAILLIRWFVRVIGLRTWTGRLAVCAIAMWLMVPGLEALDPTLGGPQALSALEETLENLGEAIMLAALLLYLGTPGRLSALAEHAGRGRRPL